MKRTLIYSLTSLLGMLSPQGQCALLSLSNSPLYLTTQVVPNVFIQLDDSGSMDWEMDMKTYWEACAYDKNYPSSGTGSTCGTTWGADDGIVSYANGSSRQFNYVYFNGDSVFNSSNPTGCASIFGSSNAIRACPTLGSYFDWRSYNSDLSVVYYSPDITYSPWVWNCTSGTPCDNASFSAARSYPISSEAGYTMTTDLAGSKYEVWIDDRGYTGSRPLRNSNINVTSTSNGIVDLWDSHVTVVFNASNAEIYSTTYNPTASGGLNPTQTLQTTLSGSGCYNALGPASLVQSIFNGSLTYDSQGAPGCQTLTQAKQNFANWYQYNRRRSMSARGALAYVINQYPNFRYGLNTINNAFFIEVPPAGTTNFAPYNNTLLNQLLTFNWQLYFTPARSGLARVGQYYSNQLTGKANPIIAACQQNYTILVTDGYWNNPDPVPSAIGDVDGDGFSQTFADVAYYYYKNNLQPSFTANQVPANSWDPATWLHMVTFPMAFGISGNLVAGTDGWPTPALGISSNWGNPFNDDPAKVDDLWHAAFNSKGSFAGAQVPALAAQSLSTMLNNIYQRALSAAPVAQNSSILNVGSQVYQGVFDSSTWTGDVLAYNINTSGVLSTTPAWSASCKLTGGTCQNPTGVNAGIAYGSRAIITRNWTGANNGIAFRWPSNYSSYKVSGNLPTNMANFLINAPYASNTSNSSRVAANQAYGQALLDYLRGNRAQEAQNGGSYGFRNRTSILGDIIDSGPTFVPSPYRLYPDSLQASAYSSFKSTYASRAPMVYVGANDGMLHGFNANTGLEVFSYVPGIRQIYQNISSLSLPTYSHYFYVDGSSTEADVYTKNAWRTILVGNLGNGGQGVYGLDITNPASFSEANAGQMYLFEFTDQDDPDLGYVQGDVSVAKVKTGSGQSEWAIIFGNGYNNSQADGYASTTGKAALFILIPSLFNGTWTLNQNYYKILVGTGTTATPNGLASPYPADINQDYIADYVYAGDLQGNIWKFNLTTNNPSNWSGSTLFTASFSAAGDQPITAQPIAGPHPNGIQYGLLVYFGTGKYLEPNDNSATGQTTQSFYAVWDKLDNSTVTKSQLVQQQILGEVTSGSNTYRVLSSNTINWNTTPSPQNRGWYINLTVSGASSNLGERQISQPVLRNGNAIFTTMLPSTSVCSVGGSSWLMEVNSATGGPPFATPFDINNDGTFTSADYITLGSGSTAITVPAAGQKSAVGMTGTPTIFLAPDKASETKVLSGGQGLGTVKENPNMGYTGRQNWRQLY